MKQSDSIVNLAKALAAVQGKVAPIGKDATNPHFRNKYASLDAIMEAVRPLLAANGLSLVQGGGAPISNVDGTVTGVAVETMLLHTSGEYIASTITLPLDKATAQAVGGAVTYGRRYGVAALLALTTDEDDDGNAASAPRTTRAVSRPALAPATSNGARNGDTGAHARPMPFGKQKGTPLGEMDTDALDSVVQWCTEKRKYADLIADCNTVLKDRLAAESAA
jgi:hypothetical protein